MPHYFSVRIVCVIIDGYRLNIGIILANKSGQLFWGRRIGQDAWQFPQGGLNDGESEIEAMYRELSEEIGLESGDVEVISVSKDWYRYKLPKQYIRRSSKNHVIGQQQKWFLLRFLKSDQKIRLDLSDTPEFDSWRWVNYWHPCHEVIFFKRDVYRKALKEFESDLFPHKRYRKK